MEILKEAKRKIEENHRAKGKLFSRAYCHTEGQWIDEWNTKYVTSEQNRLNHIANTLHEVTIHFK